MSFVEDLLPVLWSGRFRDKFRTYSAFKPSHSLNLPLFCGRKDSFADNISRSMSNFTCAHDEEYEGCRDDSYALILKLIAITAILIAGVSGVSIPLLGKKRRFLKTDSNLFVAAKAFAAGVILATGFVHILPDATSALTDPCLPKFPWSKFPFSGFITMMAALATLLADFVGTQYYERKQEKQKSQTVGVDPSSDSASESGIVAVETGKGFNNGKVFGEEEGGAMHIVGMRAHAAHHRHNHAQEEGACAGHVTEEGSHGHGHSHVHGIDDEGGVRHIVVSQVLELGIVSHSVIIGLSLGVSRSPCTIRPLIGALSFHQFFEGFALGGCILQAKFHSLRSTLMACFFAMTTPLGIAVGIGVSSIYNANSPRALITEGILDSISAGILVYMALVDLIAADFLSKRMSCNVRLQVLSYFVLFLGAVLMSSLALWA